MISTELFGSFFKIKSLKVLESRVFPDAEIPAIDIILLLIIFWFFCKIYNSYSVESSLILNNDAIVKSIDNTTLYW